MIYEIIEMEAEKYANIRCKTQEEKERTEKDYKNGMMDAYKFIFDLYLHGELSFMIGKVLY